VGRKRLINGRGGRIVVKGALHPTKKVFAGELAPQVDSQGLPIYNS